MFQAHRVRVYCKELQTMGSSCESGMSPCAIKPDLETYSIL